MGVTAAWVAVGVRRDHLENDAKEEHRRDTWFGFGFGFGFGFRFRFGLGSDLGWVQVRLGSDPVSGLG